MNESLFTETPEIPKEPGAPGAPATQTLTLIIDSLTNQPDDHHSDNANQSSDERYIQTLDVPTGQSFLFMPPGQPPQIASIHGDQNTGSKPYTLEPFRQDHQILLLLVSPPGEVVMVNGSIAPSPAILTEGDQIRSPQSDHVLHVTFFLKPYAGSPTAEMLALETECSLCRQPLREGTWVYICPFCNGATHLETEEHKVGPKPLQCAASTTTCPSCFKSLVKGEGLSFVPREVRQAVQHG